MIVGIRELADNLNLRERRLYQLRFEGLPRHAPGQYDLRECFRWYIAYLSQKIYARSHPPANSADAAGLVRHKMLSIESELKAIELAERRERLISVDKVQKDTASIIAEIRRSFGELPKKIAADIVGETDLAVSQVKIDRCLKNALAQLADYDPDEPVEPATSARSSARSRTQ